jgi:hypothetical protein
MGNHWQYDSIDKEDIVFVTEARDYKLENREGAILKLGFLQI